MIKQNKKKQKPEHKNYNYIVKKNKDLGTF